MHRRYAPGRQNERENDTLVTITNDRSEVLARHRRHERGLEPVKNYWLVFSLSAALAGCGPSHQQPRVVAVPPCLVAEHCWDEVRWAIEEHAWRFERVGMPKTARRR